MNRLTDNSNVLVQYHVWDKTIRIWHWLNVVCVIGLMGVGLVILNHKSLGVSIDGKIILKTVHAYIGYMFVINLMLRLMWGFVGNRYARWKAILPFGKKYRESYSAHINPPTHTQIN